MANVGALIRQAKIDGVALKTCPQTHQTYLNRIRKAGREYKAALVSVQESYAASKVGRNASAYQNAVSQLDAIEEEMQDLLQEVNTGIVEVKKAADSTAEKAANVTASQEALLAAEGDMDRLDPTSRRTMLDFADQYVLARYVVWAKVLVVIGVLYLVYSPMNVLLSLAIAVGIAIVYYVVTLLLALYRGRNPRGGDTEKMCADGVTAVIDNGENCPAVSTQDTYVACNMGNFGKCCWDGTPFNGEACPPNPGETSCYNSEFGCCPDAKTARTASGGCPPVVECDSSEFGCCPNGQPRTDATDVSCTFQSPCGFTAFGCCEDATAKTDLAGSNCT